MAHESTVLIFICSQISLTGVIIKIGIRQLGSIGLSAPPRDEMGALTGCNGGTGDQSVTDEAAGSTDGDPFSIEPDMPRLARIRNAISGGDANFTVDRTVVKSLADAAPSGVAGLQGVIEALTRFKLRAVRAECGGREMRVAGSVMMKGRESPIVMRCVTRSVDGVPVELIGRFTVPRAPYGVGPPPYGVAPWDPRAYLVDDGVHVELRLRLA